jgi:toxin FitB
MYLLDTNVVSELRKIHNGKADLNVTTWADRVDAAELFISVITIQELEIGVLLIERKDAKQGAMLRTWLDTQVIAKRCARLHVPDPRPLRDGLIAATALTHRMTVITRNVSDFAPTGVATMNPWLPLD